MKRRRGQRRPGVRPGVVLAGAALTGAILGVVLQQSGASLPSALTFATSPDEVDLDIHYTPPAIAPLDEPLPALDGLPAYPGSRPAALGTDIRAQATPTAVAWFATPDGVDDVLDWYERTLAEGGLPTIKYRFNPNSGYVAYHRPDDDSMHVVAVLRQGSETMVFPSVTRTSALVEARTDVPDAVPHPAAARHTSVVDMVDGGMKTTTVTGIVELARVPELVGFYERELVARGWRIDHVLTPSQDQARIEAQRANGRFEVLLNRAPMGHESFAVQIVAMKRSQAPPSGDRSR